MKSPSTTTTNHPLRVTAVCLLALSAGLPALADYSSTVLNKSPIGYWRLNETNLPSFGVATNSGSLGPAGHGLYVNGAAQVPGPLAASTDTAAKFDGFSQKVQVPFNAELNPSSEFSVEAWVKPMCIDGYDTSWYRAAVRTGGAKSGGGYQIQWDAGNSTAPGVFKFTLWNASGSLEVFNTNGVSAAGTNWTILATNGVWAHMVGTWSWSDNVAHLYINGQEVTNRSFAYTPNASAVLRIGAGDIDPSDPWGQSFDPGAISHVAVYPIALTASNVLTHYQNGTHASPALAYADLVTGDGAVGYWRLNETPPAPPVAANLGSSGSALDGKYLYASTPGVAGPQSPNYGGFETTNAAAYVSATGAAWRIPGAVTVPPVNILKTNALTITAWIKRDGFQMANANIFGRRVTGGEKSALCFLNANQLAYNWDDSSGQYNFDSKLTVPNNVWTFVAMVATPANTLLYIDAGTGLQSATNTVANTTKAAFTHDILLGPNGPYAGRLYNGAIDEVAVFTNALTAADLWDLRNAAFGSSLFIASHPATRPVMLGGKAPFTCLVAGATNYMPLSYQLLKNGSPVGSPSSSATLAYNNVQASDLTSTFSVAVTTNGGSIPSLTSSAAGITRWTIPGTYSALVESYQPAAYYRLSEASGTTVYDIGGGFDGFAYGTATRAAGPRPTGQVGYESSNNGYTLNGGFLPVLGPAITTNTVTIVAWLNPSTTSSQVNYSGIYYTRGAVDYAGFNYNNNASTQLGISWNGHYNDQTGVYAVPGYWNFAALVVSPTDATFYVYCPGNPYTTDWQSNSIVAAFPVRNLAGGYGTCIGTDPNTGLNRPIKGDIDEVAVFNQALGWADIQKLALAGFNVNLSIQKASGNNFEIDWSYGTLQWSDSPDGGWSDVPGATPMSYSYDGTGVNKKFFRASY